MGHSVPRERDHVRADARSPRHPREYARLAAVSSFYRFAADDGLIPSQPASRVKRRRIDADHSVTRGLSRSEATALLDEARIDGPRSFALATLLLLTGIRISEALSACVSDVQRDTGHRVLVVTRKGGKRAKIALPPRVVDALCSYLGTSAAEGSEVIVSEVADRPLFATSTGNRWATSGAFRTMQRLARAAGIEGRVSPQSLRHTDATLALDAGLSLRDLQDLMGHVDPRTTRRYDRARGRLERSSAYTMAAALA